MKPFLSSILLLIVFVLLGCRSARIEEPVVLHSTDTLTIIRVDTIKQDRTVYVRDSLIMKDSVVVFVNGNGEVVNKEKYSDTERWHDTDKALVELQKQFEALKRSKADEKPVYIVKEKKTKWKLYFWLGLACAVLLIIILKFCIMYGKKLIKFFSG